MSQRFDSEFILDELRETNRLLRSLESKFSILFWWAVLGVIVFCVLMSIIAYVAYLILDGIAVMPTL
jgi:hypothetical protein